MRDPTIFLLRACFMLFTSAQFLNAAKIELSDPDATFRLTATVESLFLKEPNHKDYTQSLLAKQMFLGLHNDWNSFSFYESGASYTFFTFDKKQVDFQVFHSKSMSFYVTEKNEVSHFRVVFAADKNTLDEMYEYLSAWTGHGGLIFKMNIIKVESYVKTSRTRDAIIQTVEDLEPAVFYDQKVEKGNNPTALIFKITPPTAKQITRQFPRLVFRTGNFRIGKVDDKVVIELEGFPDCLYILHFKYSYRAETFLSHTSLDGTVDHDVLDIPPDVQSYLKDESPPAHPQNESEPQSTSQSDERDPRTLSLANWEEQHSTGDQESPRNERNRSDSDRDWFKL